MAGNKTKQSHSSVTAFVEAMGDVHRRMDAKLLVKLMKDATGEMPRMWGPSIIGFGSYHYVYESGREGAAPLVAFSPRKSAIVLYLHLGLSDADALLARLGKHSSGKGCLYIKKLADADQRVLQQIIAQAAARMRQKHSVK